MFDADFGNRIKIIIAATCCVVASGCANVNYVRDAQDAFSRAAEKDNKHSLTSGVDTQGALFDELEKRASYTAVISSVDNISNTDKDELMADKLWGTMLTIKAFSQWRLGEYAKTMETHDEALKNPDQLLPRDKAMIKALPDLVRNDQAYQIMTADKQAGDNIKDKVYWKKNIEALLLNAVEGLSKVGKFQSENKQLALYLKQAEIAAAVNLRDSYRYYQPCADGDTGCSSSYSKNDKNLEKKLNDMARILFAIKSCDAKKDTVLAIWRKRTGKDINKDMIFSSCP